MSRSRCRGRLGRGEVHMLLIIGAVIVVVALVVIPWMRAPGAANSVNLGCMSEQWLAEHRASHSL